MIFDSRSYARLLLTVVVFSATALIIACGSDKTDTNPNGVEAIPTASAVATSSVVQAPPIARRGGTLHIAQDSDPASCDLHSASALSYKSVHPCNPLLSQLIRASATDHSVIEPDLAVEWTVNDSGTEWRFQLRNGVTWHDGTPFTVDDAVFSLRRAIDPPPGIAPGRASAIARYISSTDQIRADGDVLVIETDYPAASFLPNLASVYVSIYPREATEALSPPSMSAFESVIGTGPFMPGPAIRGSRYLLVRNDNYYLPGLPYLDAVEFHVMPEPAVRMAAIRSHQIDTIPIITETEALSLDEGFPDRITVHRTPSAGGNTVQMNLNQPPFDDKLVRMAVNLAISRSDAELALGEGFIGAILPPGGQFALPRKAVLKLAGYGNDESNRKKARILLADAGFPDGFSTTIKTRANPFFQTLSEFVSGQLAEIGIDARVVPVEPVAYQNMITNGDFAMIGHSHSFALDDPDSVLPSHYGCGGAENFPGLCDTELDRQIRRQSREMNVVKRAMMLNKIERRIWRENAKIWFQWSARRTPVWNSVVGLEPGGPSLYQGRRLEQVFLQAGG